MSGVFMDGGNHDSVSHGIDHGGHDHGHHGVHHGHGQGGHSLIAQILGLDQQDHAHLAHHGGEGAEGLAPSQSTSWNSALQGLKLENLLAGINITPNFLLLMLFASFVGWLGVVYWIRHHEPFANQILGSPYAPTAAADRRLISSAREAMPFKTVAHSGMVYVPNSQNPNPPAGSQVNNSLSQAMSSAFGQSPNTASAAPAAAAPAASANVAALSAPGSSPVNQSLSAAMAAAMGGGSGPAPAPAMPMSQGAQDPLSAMSAQMGGAMGSPMGGQMGSPMAGQMGAMAGGSARLFSSRNGFGAENRMQRFAQSQSMGAAAPMGSAPMGARLYSSRRAMVAQAPSQPAQAQVQPALAPAPVVDPNVWSLANQGGNTFSSDTAQFNSQFGEPLAGQAQAANR